MTTPIVLVTGALSGIGRATAIAFAREGANVVISGRRLDAGRALLKELRDMGPDAEFVQTDVRHENDVEKLVQATTFRFGRLDIAVNNAGTEGKPGPLINQTPESYADTFDTNVLGVLLCMKHQLRVMMPQGSGSIINVSSTFGQRGGVGASIYAASKHAVEGMTKCAALEAAPFGIRVNVVAPGPVDTDMLTRFSGNDEKKVSLIAGVPLKRMGDPHEIAESIVFMASHKASFITGTVLSVNGGKTAM
jgi:NAD(P)-dependent dehydrogenase (short-subunit alcohol dehydrogenase family)